MMDLKDEYIRNYAFEPEFIVRKDSMESHKTRLEKSPKPKKKLRLIDTHKSLPDSESSNKFASSIIEDEVYSFCTVNILRIDSLTLKIWGWNTCKTFYVGDRERPWKNRFKLALKIKHSECVKFSVSRFSHFLSITVSQ